MLTKNLNANNVCKYSNWYKLYEKLTIESKIINIPANVLEYFRNELIILPKECIQMKYEAAGSSTDFDNDDDDDAEVVEEPEFPDFSSQITDALCYFDNSVFIKTNWHCPVDAAWINTGNSLKVKDLVDFYQLIKASSICKEDLNDTACDEHNIIIKKWVDIHPGTEFRCFVKNHCIIAISPRDWPQYHEFIVNQRTDIINDIVCIFKEKIKETFPLSDYCFDVVRQTKDNVILVDFAPFDRENVNSLGFDWEYLENELNNTDDDPEFRYLSSDIGIQPNSRNNFGIPKDIIDMFKTKTENNDTNSTSVNDLIQNFIQQNSTT